MNVRAPKKNGNGKKKNRNDKRKREDVKFNITFNGVEDKGEELNERKKSRKNSNGRKVNREQEEFVTSDMNVVNEKNETQNESSEKKDEKCVFFPNCTKQDCPFFHPTETCKAFPSCAFGKSCRYIHPDIPCKYGNLCQRVNCGYTHPKKNPNPCKNGFSCPEKNTCEFYHPPEACKFGMACTRKVCQFSHAKPCKFGIECKVVGCSFSHKSGTDTEQNNNHGENVEQNTSNGDSQLQNESTNPSISNLIINQSDIEEDDEFINIED